MGRFFFVLSVLTLGLVCACREADDFVPPPTPSSDIVERLQGSQTLAVPDLHVYVVRSSEKGLGGQAEHMFRTDVAEDRIEKLFLNWDTLSVKPLLLQMGITFLPTRFHLHNIHLSSNFHNINHFFGPSPRERCWDNEDYEKHSWFQLTDHDGKKLFDEQHRSNITDYGCEDFKIMIAKHPHLLPGINVPATGGIACCHLGSAPLGTGKELLRGVIISANTTRNVLAHEIGHLMGLEHTNNKKSCVQIHTGLLGTDKLVPRSRYTSLMGVVIYDLSVDLYECETVTALSVLRQHMEQDKEAFSKGYIARKAPFEFYNMGSSELPWDRLNEAWHYLNEPVKNPNYKNSGNRYQESNYEIEETYE